MATVQIEVTQEIIDKGQSLDAPSRFGDCPMALAIRRKIPKFLGIYMKGSFAIGYVDKNETRIPLRLTQEMCGYIIDADFYVMMLRMTGQVIPENQIKPKTFTWEIPDDIPLSNEQGE